MNQAFYRKMRKNSKHAAAKISDFFVHFSDLANVFLFIGLKSNFIYN